MSRSDGNFAEATAASPEPASVPAGFRTFNRIRRHNDPQYSGCERHNADSHLRGTLMGQTLCLQDCNLAVLPGTWQGVILAEFDGPRSHARSIQVSGT